METQEGLSALRADRANGVINGDSGRRFSWDRLERPGAGYATLPAQAPDTHEPKRTFSPPMKKAR
ncbi:hypothetical protein ZRA01_32260 [Zoogloea ramigera]|uniref:Uncharacterized protein n=1 Tax=Zoogloea ramigera TaxID=350 RepID=A0A4Y4D0P8_ZOORA|nr:hypothetical protein ZRA01_32260 [Zoogloea ramigera]